jgi:Tol biopolymer transport system component/DNA-binding winged helix-turn-helix (wHTH) protein
MLAPDCRNGVSEQYLADQPLSRLTALVERPGELVTREELRQRLWPDGTFVGFDHGLNSAINRLREALNDSADTPRFIETIPRRGYRLLVPIEVARPTLVPAVRADAPVESTPDDRACTAIDLDLPAEAYQATPYETSGTIKRTRRLLWWMAVTAISVLSLGGLLWQRRGAQPAPLLANVAIDVPADWRNLKNHSPAISPDSQYIAISAFHRSGRSAIWLRPLGGTTWRMLSHTENGTGPFWSPDGRSIGFFAEDKLKVLRLAEGSVRVVCDAPPGSGTFVSSSVVLVAPGRSGGVTEVNVETGAFRDVTWPGRETGNVTHGHPTSLPDGRHFTYVAKRAGTSVAMLASLDSTVSVSLGPVQSQVQPTDSGQVLFVRDGALLAQQLEVTAGRLTGEPKILAEGLTAPGWRQDGRFSASPAMLVYLNVLDPFPVSELRIFERSGQSIGTVAEAARYSGPSLSPEGARLAVAMSQPSSPARDIWVFDLVRGNRTRLTLDPHDDLAPRWSADGQWLMFTSDRRGERDLYKRLASGERAEELVLESAIPKSLNDWSPDGRLVVYDTGAFSAIGMPDLHLVALSGERRQHIVAAQAAAHQAAISPDGRFVAYASSQSGRYQVIVETFPEKSGHWQITTDGGQNPTWRGDGRELIYTTDDTVLAIDVNIYSGGLAWSAPRALFRIPNLTGGPVRGLTVSADGQRFIAAVPTTSAPQQRLTTVLNWTALLK